MITGNELNAFEDVSFKGCFVVACGTLRMELESLRRSGFLDADKVLYCAPGLHEWPWELEKQLPRQLRRAAETSSKIIVLYGKKCFKDLHQPARETDALIQETVSNAVRVNAAHCVDMLASLEEREKLAGSEKVLGFIAERLSKDSYVNIMAQYYPSYRALEFPSLTRRITSAEFNDALTIARDFGLHRGF